ncbi:toll/interleukin-1 receptor domain-containing protein [Chitinophaga varians]|uniref:toll/interleukin-1 receptor domain-containing protein n=1 Tax=Chitinophaga varians TaxID=2202339 RepID=UPI00165ED829|nr:toll/interleukin-1 receptor domain-containing protein [Chitinophaga varians]MBC9911038.1 toll/interleukin-1 receptor domain-containing protein [Chitinophaga varians]
MALNRFYLPHSKTRQEFLAQNIKCIFISHQQKDKDHAQIIADYLMSAGLDVYFDKYDSDLRIHHQSGNPKKVTEAICSGINNSSHMLVLVSPNTLSSTWVPFEIGYGFDKIELLVLCLKGIEKGSLPEYIRSAPIIRDIWDLNNKVSFWGDKSLEQLTKANVIPEYSSLQNPLRHVMDSLIIDNY